MISAREIRSRARELGVPETTIERDYAQNWLLGHLASMNMALKGGTGIRKVYIENYRFSDDLDFTLLEKMDSVTLNDSIENAVIGAKETSGINFIEEISIEENINGFVVNVYFRILRSTGNPIKIKLDLTAPERETVLLPLEKRKIIHQYSDDFHARIRAYSLEEIVAEKIRALFERTRPRDLYDVWHLHNEINNGKVLNILYKKCMVKDVKIDVQSLEDRRVDFADAWTNSLRHQIKALPNFDDVFCEVEQRIAGLL
jgi:predicted nucleotidyltransferase component of viral defense system